MDTLDLVKLSPLMELTRGKARVVIGLIDGPVALDHPDLSGQNIRAINDKTGGRCSQANSMACMHGTFVAGILSAKRGSAAPAICPDCTLIVRAIFSETASKSQNIPSATPGELASAIIECIDAGAHVLNLSVALDQPSSGNQRELAEALDYAARRGVIIVAAAGNQGTIASTIITRHPWVIPVVACDLKGRSISHSNLAGSIGRQGLSAPGDAITSLGTNSKPLTSGGTSAAAPFVTGAIALLLSEFSDASTAAVKLAVTQASAPRRATVVPPLLDAWAAYQSLSETHSRRRKKIMEQNQTSQQSSNRPAGGAINASTIVQPSGSRAGTLIYPQGAGGGCGCGGAASAEGAENGNGTNGGYVFAIGKIEMRFPSLGVEKEFVQATGRAETAGLTDQQAAQAVLSERPNRYIARQICWVFTIEGLETYILVPRDSADYDLLLDAVRVNPNLLDVDVIIGMRGPVAPPEMCNGLQVPIVVFDQIYSFDRDALVKAIPRPESVAAKQDKQFRSAAGELFDRFLQLADNAGATDEHRAMNYLAVRYPAVYATATELYDRDFALSSVDVQPSRLSGLRKIVDVIFSFTNRKTDVGEKYFVRVDVTEEFPFLVTRMSPYYDR
jgi:PatG C-terminal/Subtilase family